MPLQSSGAISLNDIQGEFGGSNPIGLNEYYRGGSYVTTQAGNNINIPTSGTISLGNFYATAAITIPTLQSLSNSYTIAGTTLNYTYTATLGSVNLTGSTILVQTVSQVFIGGTWYDGTPIDISVPHGQQQGSSYSSGSQVARWGPTTQAQFRLRNIANTIFQSQMTYNTSYYQVGTMTQLSNIKTVDNATQLSYYYTGNTSLVNETGQAQTKTVQHYFNGSPSVTFTLTVAPGAGQGQSPLETTSKPQPSLGLTGTAYGTCEGQTSNTITFSY